MIEQRSRVDPLGLTGEAPRGLDCGKALRGGASIEDALSDPIVQLWMRRDGLSAADVVEVIRQTPSKVTAHRRA